jgi:hypothetical protein
VAGIKNYATKGSPREFASARAAELHGRPRPSTYGLLVRTAFLGWLLAFLVGAGSLLAGDKGMVTGTVAGPSKIPIPGAKVTLATADGNRQSVTADQHGHYSFPSVEPATYTLSAEAAGYQPATRPEVRVTGGASTTVDLLLVPAGSLGPSQALPALQQPTYYDDTQLKASAVKSTIDAAGYSSQAQSPQRLLSEGPSLTGERPSGPHAGAGKRRRRGKGTQPARGPASRSPPFRDESSTWRVLSFCGRSDRRDPLS